MSIDQLLSEFSDPPYTREQFEADKVRVVDAIATKHGIAENEVDALIREHRYQHTLDADGGEVEQDYIELCAVSRTMGWPL